MPPHVPASRSCTSRGSASLSTSRVRPLAIELAFDPASSDRLAAAWARLSPLSGSPSGSELGVRPHITLALFRSGEPDDPAGVAGALADAVAPFRLSLSAADHFGSDEGVVFLRPDSSAELARAHAALHALLDGARDLVHPYYRPGAWQPHCTMALGVPPEALEAVLDECRAPDVLGEVEAVRVQVVRYRPATEVAGAALDGRRAG